VLIAYCKPQLQTVWLLKTNVCTTELQKEYSSENPKETFTIGNSCALLLPVPDKGARQ
jgi:hypothetical protein